MTAKEKALELIDKMWLHSNCQDGAWIDRDLAKQCALIVVDEMLNELWDGGTSLSYYKFWKEVKNEIEKL